MREKIFLFIDLYKMDIERNAFLVGHNDDDEFMIFDGREESDYYIENSLKFFTGVYRSGETFYTEKYVS